MKHKLTPAQQAIKDAAQARVKERADALLEYIDRTRTKSLPMPGKVKFSQINEETGTTFNSAVLNNPGVKAETLERCELAILSILRRDVEANEMAINSFEEKFGR